MRSTEGVEELTLEESKTLITAILHNRTSVDKDEIIRIGKWADGAVFDYALLLLILAGDISIQWHPDDIEPTFTKIKDPR